MGWSGSRMSFLSAGRRWRRRASTVMGACPHVAGSQLDREWREQADRSLGAGAEPNNAATPALTERAEAERRRAASEERGGAAGLAFP